MSPNLFRVVRGLKLSPRQCKEVGNHAKQHGEVSAVGLAINFSGENKRKAEASANALVLARIVQGDNPRRMAILATTERSVIISPAGK